MTNTQRAATHTKPCTPTAITFHSVTTVRFFLEVHAAHNRQLAYRESRNAVVPPNGGTISAVRIYVYTAHEPINRTRNAVEETFVAAVTSVFAALNANIVGTGATGAPELNVPTPVSKRTSRPDVASIR
jgi:hypothetical protein